ncbi:ATP-binding protein [Thermopolyspora sp. NPDC052614]|uniref:ATP-binding protein n=1 Tax=Thermopolyspora sp. NPDC052614 TaxID=3155682 RepID=UPI003436DC66
MTAGRIWSTEIPFDVRSVSVTRRDVRKVLADWGYGHAIDDVTLIISELVSNAVAHGAPAISLTLQVSGHILLGEVVDHGLDLPHLVNADDVAEHGRGLAMVRMMTCSLGWSRTPDGAKSVWFGYRLFEA